MSELGFISNLTDAALKMVASAVVGTPRVRKRV
jgi:hypothetical protein